MKLQQTANYGGFIVCEVSIQVGCVFVHLKKCVSLHVQINYHLQVLILCVILTEVSTPQKTISSYSDPWGIYLFFPQEHGDLYLNQRHVYSYEACLLMFVSGFGPQCNIFPDIEFCLLQSYPCLFLQTAKTPQNSLVILDTAPIIRVP